MIQCIKDKLSAYGARHPKMRQWGWFVLLWLGGLSVVLMISGIIKLIFRYMASYS